MAESKIIVRMSKSSGIYNKSNKYEVIINNEAKAELDYVNNRQIFTALLNMYFYEVFLTWPN